MCCSLTSPLIMCTCCRLDCYLEKLNPWRGHCGQPTAPPPPHPQYPPPRPPPSKAVLFLGSRRLLPKWWTTELWTVVTFRNTQFNFSLSPLYVLAMATIFKGPALWQEGGEGGGGGGGEGGGHVLTGNRCMDPGLFIVSFYYQTVQRLLLWHQVQLCFVCEIIPNVGYYTVTTLCTAFLAGLVAAVVTWCLLPRWTHTDILRSFILQYGNIIHKYVCRVLHIY